MKINHIAIWTNKLEEMKDFYVKYFHVTPNKKYTNSLKAFESYFLTFASGAKLELMYTQNLCDDHHHEIKFTGYAHIAVTAACKLELEALYLQLINDGFTITSPPRTTGDGYYEFAFLDPDGNTIEITL